MGSEILHNKSSMDQLRRYLATDQRGFAMPDWQRLTGYMTLKLQGGSFSLLWPRRRYYFVLDEAHSRLVYFRHEIDFATKKPASGQILLPGCTLSAGATAKQFVISTQRQQFELETDKPNAATIWMQCIQQYMDYGPVRKDTPSLPNQPIGLSNVVDLNASTLSLPSYHDISNWLDKSLKTQSHSRPRLDSECDVDLENPLSPTESDGQPCVFYFHSDDDGDHSDDGSLKSAPVNVQRRESAMSQSKHAESLHRWVHDWLSSHDIEDEFIMIPQGIQNGHEPAASEPPHRTDLREDQVHSLNSSGSRGSFMNGFAELFAKQRSTSSPARDNPNDVQAQNRVLNDEISRLTKQVQSAESTVKLNTRIKELEHSLEKQRRDYVFLLQSCIRIPLTEKGKESAEVRLFGGSKHKERIAELLDEARESDPTMPSIDTLASGGSHMDIYGFQHTFTDEGLLLQYLCTQLHGHYQQHEQQASKERWKVYLKSSQGLIVNNKETRQLVREGIPPGYRSNIWRRLIHQQVADLKLKHGKYYYKNLISTPPTAEGHKKGVSHHKQITLDLLRTMPNNIYFSASTCKGVSQIQEVLYAFCLHNHELGYCQGMNFIVGTALLFLGPEDAFWLLVAMTEKYFVAAYFDAALSGAQADQEVLKELVEEKLPDLHAHLLRTDIELATVTLNWFLAVFFDCVPFDTMLRIWDCFLLEGPKILFRFALALLLMHQDSLMEKPDTISVMKVLKTAAKYTFDAEGLCRTAFEGLRPFPNRKTLARRQTAYLTALKERLRKREELRNAMSQGPYSPGPNARQVTALTMHLAVSFGSQVMVVCGNQHTARMATVDLRRSVLIMQRAEFECRVLAATVVRQTVYMSLLSAMLVAVNGETGERLWEVPLRDVASCIAATETALFCGMSNGSLAVIEKIKSDRAPDQSDVFYIPLGPAPVSALCVTTKHIWCAIASKAKILQLKTLDPVEEVYLASSVSGGTVAFFERVQTMHASAQFGVCLALQKSALVQLWDPVTFTSALLYDISQDVASGQAKTQDTQITSLLSHESHLWIGTSDGYLLIYEVKRKQGIRQQQPRGSIMRLPAESFSRASSLLATPEHPSIIESENSGSDTDRSTNISVTGSQRKSKQAEIVEKESSNKRALELASSQTPDGCFRAPLTASEQEITNLNSPTEPKPEPGPVQMRRKVSAADRGRPMSLNRMSVQMQQRSCSPALSTRSQKGHRSSVHIVSDTEEGAIADVEMSPFRRKVTVNVLDIRKLSSARSGSDLAYYENDQSTGGRTVPPMMTNASRNHSREGLATYQLRHGDSTWSLDDLSASQVNLADDKLAHYNRDAGNDGTDQDGTDTEETEVDVTIKRKDLDLEDFLRPAPTLQITRPDSPTGSDSTVESDMDRAAMSTVSRHSRAMSIISIDGSSIEVPFQFEMTLMMMLKISDKPVTCLTACKVEDTDVVTSCAGNYGDDEAVLRWSKDQETKLWTNDPVIEENELQRQLNKSPFSRLRLPRNV